MKKINAFYCIKTPSDWKESVLMYDKPTEKNKMLLATQNPKNAKMRNNSELA